MKMMLWIVSTQLLAITYVMMKTTMLIATMMVGIVKLTTLAQLSVRLQQKTLMNAVVRFSSLNKIRNTVYSYFSYILFFSPASMPYFMLNAARFVPAEIVGGGDAPSPIPWQVSVQFNNVHFCGATILDKKTLLSAASCFYGKFDSTNGISIRAGSVHKSDGGQVCLLFICQSLFASWILV